MSETLGLHVAFHDDLLALWRYLGRPGSDGRLAEKDYTYVGHYGMHPAHLRATIGWLVEHGWMRATTDAAGSGGAHEFTSAGAMRAELLAMAAADAPIVADAPARLAAADAADALIGAVGASNQLAADHPERVPMYRASMEAGAGLLRAHAPTRAVVRATMLDPANWILQQAATAAVRDAAEHAIRLLTALL